MLAREMEELLAEGVHVMTSEFTPEAMGEGIEPYEAKVERRKTAHGASRLGNWGLGQLGRMR